VGGTFCRWDVLLLIYFVAVRFVVDLFLVETFCDRTFVGATNQPSVSITHDAYILAYLRVLIMRGVSQATQAPVSIPNSEEHRRNIQYSEHLAQLNIFIQPIPSE